MKIQYIIYLAAAAGLSACASHHEHHAKISRQDAEMIALRQVPAGTIKEGELEKEKGKLIWSFDIIKPDSKNITEVAVDAFTGAIVAVDIETPKDQEREAKQDAKEARKKQEKGEEK